MDRQKVYQLLQCLLLYLNEKGNQRFGYWDKNIDFVRTDDFFKTPAKVLVKHGNRFLFTKKFLFVAQVNPLEYGSRVTNEQRWCKYVPQTHCLTKLNNIRTLF